jgi:hypothetical protein
MVLQDWINDPIHSIASCILAATLVHKLTGVAYNFSVCSRLLILIQVSNSFRSKTGLLRLTQHNSAIATAEDQLKRGPSSDRIVLGSFNERFSS